MAPVLFAFRSSTPPSPHLPSPTHPSTPTPQNTTGKDKKRQTMPSQLCSLGHSAARDLGTPRSSSSTMCFVLQLVIIRKVVVVRCVGVGVLQQYYPTSPRRGRQVLDAASGLGRKVCCEEQTHDGTHEGVQTVKKLVLIFSVSSAPQRGRCWIQMKNCHHFLSSILSTTHAKNHKMKPKHISTNPTQRMKPRPTPRERRRFTITQPLYPFLTTKKNTHTCMQREGTQLKLNRRKL